MSDPIREQALERSLPNSAEAERAILGGIILDNVLMPQAIELLGPEAFYVPSHRTIYRAMITIFQRGEEINPIIIAEELKKEQNLDGVGGLSFITNLTYGLPHSTNIANYAKLVRGKAMLRQLVRSASAVVQEALAQESEPEVILDHAEAAIFSLANDRLREGFTHVKPAAEILLDKIQAMEGRPSVITGLATGFNDWDKRLSGLQKQDLIILGGRPSMGKTATALQLALNVGKEGGVVGIFELEMSKEALVMRMLCANGNIDVQRFRNGFLSRPEWAQIAKSLGELAEMRIFLDDTAAIGTLELRAKARRLAAEQKRLDLLIVDQLGLMSGHSKRFESRQQEVAQNSRELKSIAKELDVPLLVLSQLSRAPELRSDHTPTLADLRDSGEIEQVADVVAFLFRPEYYLAPGDPKIEDVRNLLELVTAKQRNGPTGTDRMRWTPSSMRVDNMYKEPR